MPNCTKIPLMTHKKSIGLIQIVSDLFSLQRKLYPFSLKITGSCRSVKWHFYEAFFIFIYCCGTKALSTGQYVLLRNDWYFFNL